MLTLIKELNKIDVSDNDSMWLSCIADMVPVSLPIRLTLGGASQPPSSTAATDQTPRLAPNPTLGALEQCRQAVDKAPHSADVQQPTSSPAQSPLRLPIDSLPSDLQLSPDEREALAIVKSLHRRPKLQHIPVSDILYIISFFQPGPRHYKYKAEEVRYADEGFRSPDRPPVLTQAERGYARHFHNLHYRLVPEITGRLYAGTNQCLASINRTVGAIAKPSIDHFLRRIRDSWKTVDRAIYLVPHTVLMSCRGCDSAAEQDGIWTRWKREAGTIAGTHAVMFQIGYGGNWSLLIALPQTSQIFMWSCRKGDVKGDINLAVQWLNRWVGPAAFDRPEWKVVFRSCPTGNAYGDMDVLMCYYATLFANGKEEAVLDVTSQEDMEEIRFWMFLCMLEGRFSAPCDDLLGRVK